MGLMLAEPGFHTRAFVEWEEYPRSAIIAAQRAGYFAPAPIWDDLRSFDGRPFCGAFDTILAGYPCQPFSQAGKRLGSDDPRHLWPHVARVIREVEPEWVFLENVAGHITLGAETVLRTLWDMGYTPAAGAFSAAEVGAPHERLRWFCVAHRAGRGCGIVGDAAQPGCRGHADGGNLDLADPHGGHTRPERQQRGGQQRLQQEGRGNSGRSLDHAERDGRSPGRGGNHGKHDWIEPDPEGQSMADSDKHGRQRSAQLRAGWPADPAECRADAERLDAQLAHACQSRPQGGEQPGSSDQRLRAPASGPTAERGGLPLFPPGPSDRDTWAAVMASSPDRAPSIARRDVLAAAVNLTALLGPDEAEALEPRLRDLPRGAGMAAVVREAHALVDQAQAFTRIRNLADGLAGRTRALRLLGNGVHPLAAAHAWRTLAVAHGLGPVDLEAACLGSNASPDDDGVVM